MMKKEEIIVRRVEEIGLMEINNPPHNYLERPDFIKLETIKKFVNTGIKALIISGTGRNFSAGANLISIQRQIKDKKQFHEQLIKGNQLLNYLDELDIPVIAAISGVCFGAGLEIALASDIRYCEKDSIFAFPEVNNDLIPGLGGIRRMISITGKSTALDLILEGNMINAEKSLELKLVDRIVEKKKVAEYAVTMARKMTINRPLKVIQSIMRSVHNAGILESEALIREDARLFTELALDLNGIGEQ